MSTLLLSAINPPKIYYNASYFSTMFLKKKRKNVHVACADPEFFLRFGGGVPMSSFFLVNLLREINKFKFDTPPRHLLRSAQALMQSN